MSACAMLYAEISGRALVRPQSESTWRPWSVQLAAACSVLLALAVFGSATLAAQPKPSQASVPPRTQNQAAASSPSNSAAPSPNNILAAAQPAGQPAPGVSATPDAPPPPDWPVNDRPADATVSWDSHGLSIVASNSSLSHILRQISAETGATLEGFGKDERVFGVYGPGPARDVITQLLDGTGYNVLMIGDQGQGTPRQIILTARSTGGAQPAGAGNPNTSNDDDADGDQQAQQPEPQPPPQQHPAQPQNGTAPPLPVRSQQQLIQELQQRQQQMQQQNPQQQQ